jgi:membrane protein
MKKLKGFFRMFWDAGKILSMNEPLILCSATSYYAVFAIPAILLILIYVFGRIINPELIEEELFGQLQEALGEDTAKQMEVVIANMLDIGENWKITVFSIAIFLIASTSLFIVIQKSINRIWEIKAKPKNNYLNKLKDRGFAMIVILAGGVLAFISFLAEFLLRFMSDFVDSLFGIGITTFELLNTILTLFLMAVWYAMVFKLLPDAKIKWKPVIIGAVFTAFLFFIGKIVVEFLFIGRLDDWWGGLTSVVLILIFIFYISFLSYYGASFIRVMVESKGKKIEPADYATTFSVEEG